MSRSLYHLHFNIEDETQELQVTEENLKARPLSLDMNAHVIATYSVDNNHDFGSIRIEDAILDMHEAELTIDTGIVKIADGFYSKNDVSFSIPTNGEYNEFVPKDSPFQEKSE